MEPSKIAADHLMATGVVTREEARERAAAHAVELGLPSPDRTRERQREAEYERGYGLSM